MRWILDGLVLAAAACVLVGIVAYHRAHARKDALVERARGEVRRLELELRFRAASGLGELNPRGWPVTIEPGWFEDSPPLNPLLDTARPWVEVATLDQAELLHPRVRMAVSSELAAFWYNPYQGVVRARVAVMESDEDAASIYNRVNGSLLRTIFDVERGDGGDLPPPARPAGGVRPGGANGGEGTGSGVELTPTGHIRRRPIGR